MAIKVTLDLRIDLGEDNGQPIMSSAIAEVLGVTEIRFVGERIDLGLLPGPEQAFPRIVKLLEDDRVTGVQATFEKG